MNNLSNLKQLEKNIFLSYFQDGVIDITVGLLFLFNGLMMAIGKVQFAGLGVMFILLIVPLKKLFIFPRTGYVKFHITRQRKIQRSAIGFYVGGIAGFLAALFMVHKHFQTSLVNDYAFTLMGLIIALLPTAGAVITGIKRFYIYGLLILTVFAIEDFTHSTAPAGFITFGSIMLVTGIFYLANFIKKYPVPANEV